MLTLYYIGGIAMEGGYFGNIERSHEVAILVLSGLKRRLDREIDEILEKNLIDNIVEAADEVKDAYMESAIDFLYVIFGIGEDERETARETVIKYIKEQWNLV